MRSDYDKHIESLRTDECSKEQIILELRADIAARTEELATRLDNIKQLQVLCEQHENEALDHTQQVLELKVSSSTSEQKYFNP